MWATVAYVILETWIEVTAEEMTPDGAPASLPQLRCYRLRHFAPCPSVAYPIWKQGEIEYRATQSKPLYAVLAWAPAPHDVDADNSTLRNFGDRPSGEE